MLAGSAAAAVPPAGFGARPCCSLNLASLWLFRLEMSRFVVCEMSGRSAQNDAAATQLGTDWRAGDAACCPDELAPLGGGGVRASFSPSVIFSQFAMRERDPSSFTITGPR